MDTASGKPSGSRSKKWRVALAKNGVAMTRIKILEQGMWQLHWATSSMTGMAAQAEESEKIAQRLQQENANSEDRREFGTISIHFRHGFAQVLDRYC